MSSRVVSRKSVHAEIEKYKEVIKVLYIKNMVETLKKNAAKNTKAVKETKEKLKKVVEEVVEEVEEEEENYDHDEYERRLDEYLDRDYDY
jgi:gas vesicle protein